MGVGIVGAGYVVTQYVLNKLNDARERMSSDRIAKEKCALPPLPTSRTCLYCPSVTLGTMLTRDLLDDQPPPALPTEPGGLHVHRAGPPTDRGHQDT